MAAYPSEQASEGHILVLDEARGKSVWNNECDFNICTGSWFLHTQVPHTIFHPGKKETRSEFKATFQSGRNPQGGCEAGPVRVVALEGIGHGVHLAPGREVPHPWAERDYQQFYFIFSLLKLHLFSNKYLIGRLTLFQLQASEALVQQINITIQEREGNHQQWVHIDWQWHSVSGRGNIFHLLLPESSVQKERQRKTPCWGSLGKGLTPSTPC